LKDTVENSISESYFKEDAEKFLYANLQKFNDNVDYKSYLNELENLNPSVTKFFDDVLVMDKDENVKKNRLALLTLLRKKYDFLTDFSKV
jgi:glycyl-tRNA synthetase beta chain